MVIIVISIIMTKIIIAYKIGPGRDFASIYYFIFL